MLYHVLFELEGPSRCAIESCNILVFKHFCLRSADFTASHAAPDLSHSHWHSSLKPLLSFRSALKALLNENETSLQNSPWSSKKQNCASILLNCTTSTSYGYFMYPWNQKKTLGLYLRWKFLAVLDRLSHQALYGQKQFADHLVVVVLFSVQPGTGNFPPDNSCFSLKFLHHLWAVRSAGGGLKAKEEFPSQNFSFPIYFMQGFHQMILLTF